MLGLISALLLSAAGPTAAAPAAASFDAGSAWSAFASLMHDRYGYYDRPGIDGDAILARFRPTALAAPDRAAFIDVLQLAAHNFADPHLIVGPLDARDYSVVPTSSDLHGHYRADRFIIDDVRFGGDAQAQGIVLGAEVVAIDGLPTAKAVERVMGRPVGELSAPQADAGLNIALAGIRKQRRSIALRFGGRTRTYDLAPASALADAVDARPPLDVIRRGDVIIVTFNNALGDNATIGAFRAAVEAAGDARAIVLDFRNTPSGGNTTVARAIMGHFVDRERPYQVHVVPSEARVYGVPRKFVEYVLPIAPRFNGGVAVIGGHWTGSMGEGLMIGFDSIGALTAGSDLAHLLGALFNEDIDGGSIKIDLGLEQLFHIDGRPREAFRPALYRDSAEATATDDPTLEAVIAALDRP